MPSGYMLLFQAAVVGLILWAAIAVVLPDALATVIGVSSIAAAAVWLRKRYSDLEREWLHTICAEYPGFDKYYAIWKDYRHRQNRELVATSFQAAAGAAVIAVAAVAIVGVAMGATAAAQNAATQREFDDWAVRRDVRRIADAVERL